MGSPLFFSKLCAALAKRMHRRCLDSLATVTLSLGGLWSHRMRAAGFSLLCHEGSVWLTREGDACDHVLKAGEALRVEGPGLVVVQALGAARFSLSPEGPLTWAGAPR
ncbi:DUF2917 domain-containing protein [Stigmatella aurantiaca]|uniref:DUF2917 domain-containing protein n=1 Tax=Stigmatella aurantiaca (strain DW4/3-1) TaxID=378806 RepID=Q08TD5_STIAD|nr:DUF2917 domain-containing protein [Stigmatella aurantiaca]EAU63745.1 hypothetical protein STIAU_0853 [Stigmatella aurantiaca DW4/3-1]